jgi:hypothetical protein
VVLLSDHQESQVFFTSLSSSMVFVAETPVGAIAIAKNLIG